VRLLARLANAAGTPVRFSDTCSVLALSSTRGPSRRARRASIDQRTRRGASCRRKRTVASVLTTPPSMSERIMPPPALYMPSSREPPRGHCGIERCIRSRRARRSQCRLAARRSSLVVDFSSASLHRTPHTSQDHRCQLFQRWRCRGILQQPGRRPTRDREEDTKERASFGASTWLKGSGTKSWQLPLRPVPGVVWRFE